MPFTVDEFFGVFARYNEAIWPTQVLAYLAAVVTVALLRWRAQHIYSRIYGLESVKMWHRS